MKKLPAVSVIISNYNYGKYIGECFDSILAQTFQDFEVIVVDDCSTDDSIAVIESYAPKFEGRLTLTKMKTNSGGGGKPRNIGLKHSNGEYVFFMDADDVFTKTALEEMYTVAKKYKADVVYCEKYLMSSGIGEEFTKNINLAEGRMQKPPFVEEPTIETNDLAERVNKAININYWMTAWLRLVSRKLLIDNNIKFSLLIASNDFNWTLKVLFHSKRFLRVPNACYIRRIHDESVSFRERTPSEWIHKWMDRTIRSLKDMDDFMGKIKFFKENPTYRHNILDYFVKADIWATFNRSGNLPPLDVYNAFRQYFGEYLGEQDVLVSLLCSYLIDQIKRHKDKKQKISQDAKKRIHELEAEIKKLQPRHDNKVVSVRSDNTTKAPAISVIIPIYNLEEYVGECLDSVLMQTFQDFEVIVVDDCSTDNSFAVVEKYAPKFDGRLTLAKTEKNSGGAGYVPRNIGLDMARGKYVFFLDSDDFILLSALETLYKLAQEYDADVVYSSAHYRLEAPNEVILKKHSNIKKPYMIIDDSEKVVYEFLFKGAFHAPWTKFIRRDFLIKNKIYFPEIIAGGDSIWAIHVYTYSRRFLRIQVPFYFYRCYDTKAITKVKREPHEQIAWWVPSFVKLLKAWNELANKREVLRNNPAYSYKGLTAALNYRFTQLSAELALLEDKDVYDILFRELIKGNYADDSTVPFFFSQLFAFKKRLSETEQLVPELNRRIEDLENEIKQLKSNQST